MPSAVRIDWGRSGACSQLRFADGERAAVLAGYAPDLKDLEGVGSGWVDVQGCCGVHGVASLCGGRVRQISTEESAMSTNG